MQAWRDSKIQIILSEKILLEYQRVTKELLAKFPAVDLDRIIELLRIHGEIVETQNIFVSVCVDPDDDKFLECALAGSSKIIVSGDKHLLDVAGYKNIAVLKPRVFMDKHLSFSSA